MQTKEEMIENIMDSFDFTSVAITMEALDWDWHKLQGRIPTEQEIRKCARELLRSLPSKNNTDEGYEIRSGGLCARAFYKAGLFCEIELLFIVSDWSETQAADAFLH